MWTRPGHTHYLCYADVIDYWTDRSDPLYIIIHLTQVQKRSASVEQTERLWMQQFQCDRQTPGAESG